MRLAALVEHCDLGACLPAPALGLEQHRDGVDLHHHRPGVARRRGEPSADLADGRAFVLAEVGNRLVIRH